jgi:CRP/FNR family transcriptional regulator, cyclic AMP receptor protein
VCDGATTTDITLGHRPEGGSSLTTPGRFDSFFAYPTIEDSARAPLFLGTRSREDWSRVLAHTERLRFDAGQILISEGEIDRSLYIVAVGELDVLLRRPTGQLRLVATIGPGSITGEVAFVDGGPRSATIRARINGELARLSFEQYEVLAARYPELGRAIMIDIACILAARLRSADEALVADIR